MLNVVVDSIKRTPRRKFYLSIFMGICCIWALVWLVTSGGRLDYNMLYWPVNNMERHQAVDLLSVSLDEIHQSILHAHTEYLCLDALQGRGAGTEGELLAALYLAAAFESYGLVGVAPRTQPLTPLQRQHLSALAGHSGHYDEFLQPVPLEMRHSNDVSISFTTAAAPTMNPLTGKKISTKSNKGKSKTDAGNGNGNGGALQITPVFGKEFTAYSELFIGSEGEGDKTIVLDTEHLVFAGYGIDASPYAWNDYKLTNVRGKTLLLLVGEPEATNDDPTLFGGPSLTYYGRWIYKLDTARRYGAKAVIFVHTTQSAGYPFAVLTAIREKVTRADFPKNPLDAVVWVNEEIGSALAMQCGTTLAEMRSSASSRTFTPVQFTVDMRLVMEYSIRAATGWNVLAAIPASSEHVPHPPHQVYETETVLLMAHFDALGVGPEGVFKGAADNAAGVGGLLAAARALAVLYRNNPPKRQVLFAAMTGEEHGLLGAEYYCDNPAVHLDKTIAAMNIDVPNVWGAADDIVGLGADMCNLEKVFAHAAHAEHLRVSRDPDPNSGGVYRADSWAFMARGVPTVYVWAGNETESVVVGRKQYVQNHYHRVTDTPDRITDFSGTVQQSRVMARVAAMLADSTSPRTKCNRGWGIIAVDQPHHQS